MEFGDREKNNQEIGLLERIPTCLVPLIGNAGGESGSWITSKNESLVTCARQRRETRGCKRFEKRFKLSKFKKVNESLYCAVEASFKDHVGTKDFDSYNGNPYNKCDLEISVFLTEFSTVSFNNYMYLVSLINSTVPFDT